LPPLLADPPSPFIWFPPDEDDVLPTDERLSFDEIFPDAWLLLFAELVLVFAPFDMLFCGFTDTVFVGLIVLPFESAELPCCTALDVFVEFEAFDEVVGLPTFCVDCEHELALTSHGPVVWLICAWAAPVRNSVATSAEI
jgi:hypothetical protein